jgi:hypothetical protein
VRLFQALLQDQVTLYGAKHADVTGTRNDISH